MKRPLHIWVVFSICLLAALASMAWLTAKAIELEQAEVAAQFELEQLALRADFEGDVRLALRRIDLFLADVFAEEGAWPYLAYHPFYVSQSETPGLGSSDAQQESAAGMTPVASPLLAPQGKYVRLYFEVDEDNTWASPQCPPQNQQAWAAQNGIGSEQLRSNLAALEQCKSLLPPEQLWSRLPEPQELAFEPASNRILGQASPQAGLEETPPQQAASASGPELEAANRPALQGSPSATGPPQGDLQQLTQQSLDIKQRVMPDTQISRSNAEFINRQQQFGDYAWKFKQRQQRNMLLQNEAFLADQLKAPLLDDHAPGKIVEGRSRPLWVADQLVLARRVKVDGKPLLQGVWLDWKKIKADLADLARDLLPEFDVVSVVSEEDGDLGRMLATLPAQLVVRPPEPSISLPSAISPIRMSLVAAWSCLALAACAFVLLLAGVISLSERRASFVSAVTHELRTPLTTFRMYAEMLAENMVPDQARRQAYLETLKTEADRLFHLVENVLAYARLERGRRPDANLSNVTAGQLVDGMQRRLADRATQADMELLVEASESVRGYELTTDVSAVEQVIANLVDNACKYASEGTDRRIHLEIAARDRAIEIRVRDHGPGIGSMERRRLFRPFTKSAREAAHSAPGVGLGLALCRRMAKQIGARLTLETQHGDGASFLLTVPAKRP